MPPIAGADAPASTLDANGQGAQGPGPAAGGGGADEARSTAMGAIRDLGQKAEELGKLLPTIQPEIQQLRQLLRKMIIKAGQQAPTQNASAGALPMGG